MRILLAVAALAGLTMPADDGKELASALTGRVAGRQALCLSSGQIDAPRVIGDHTLLYRDGARLWRNDLPDACPGLGEDTIIVSEVRGGQLCRGDLIRTVERHGIGIPGPSCRLGGFTAWDRVKR